VEAATPQHPIAAYTPVRRFEMFDLAACALLGISGVAPARARQALAWIDGHYLQHGKLPPAFAPVIDEGDDDWPALRRYHLHAFRNAPHEYHNGGIWPIWLGWLAVALALEGNGAALDRLREAAARALAALPNFTFEEFLHGRSGAAGGTAHMAYTATGLTFLRLADAPAVRQLLAPDLPIVRA
jgi:Alkaline and neutral invertase